MNVSYNEENEDDDNAKAENSVSKRNLCSGSYGLIFW